MSFPRAGWVSDAALHCWWVFLKGSLVVAAVVLPLCKVLSLLQAPRCWSTAAGTDPAYGAARGCSSLFLEVLFWGLV